MRGIYETRTQQVYDAWLAEQAAVQTTNDVDGGLAPRAVHC